MLCWQNCTESDIKTFRCLQGLFGGNDSVTSHQYCNSTYAIKDSWFPVTCIISENNAFLGYFYHLLDFLKSVGNYDSRYSYRFSLFISSICYFTYLLAGFKARYNTVVLLLTYLNCYCMLFLHFFCALSSSVIDLSIYYKSGAVAAQTTRSRCKVLSITSAVHINL